MTHPWRTFEPHLKLGLAVAVLLPLGLLTLLRLKPILDARWEDHRGHFWLVLIASLISVGLGYFVSGAARRRRDARLLLVSFAFIVSAGFLGLHALATPGVLVGSNPGFELATPVGLLLGGLFVAASGLSLPQRVYHRLIRESRWLLGVLTLVTAIWGVVSLAELPPLDDPLQSEQLRGWQTALGASGVLLYGVGALGYFKLYRQRHARFIFAMAFAFTLLAEAMVIIVFAQSWEISWWEWHTLMLGAFLLIATTARQEWSEERFSALYLDETLAGTKEASILFADLQAFTSYAEQAEPAEVAEMLNTYFDRIVPLMEQMEGDVHQIMGDAIMVVFNKEGNQPEHAILAARAALALQQEAASVGRPHPDWPRFRVGVNSGDVLAGVMGGAQGHRRHGVVGDTVNLAARLESKAPAGEVVVGEGTYSRLPEGSRVQSLMPLRMKGKKELVAAYILREIPSELVTTIETSSWRGNLHRAARKLAFALWGGLISGAVVGGIGGRLCMLVLRWTSDPSLRGIKTDDGFAIGQVTPQTAFLVISTALLGGVSALCYLVVRPWLPRYHRPLSTALLGGAVGGAVFIRPGGLDFTLVEPLSLAVGMFIALSALHGLVMSALIERLLFLAQRPRRLIFTPMLLIPLILVLALGPLPLLEMGRFAWLPVVLLGLVWALNRKVRLVDVWASQPAIFIGRAALLGGGLFALTVLARDLRAIL